MKSRLKWIAVWSLWAARLVSQPTLPVRVSGGELRGTVAHDGSHRQYLGIPYAVVKDRFQKPVPAPPWEGILDAFKENIRCFQRFTSNTVLGQVDCLTLNVYTPLDDEPLKPVMVFIHGGGFRDGSGSPFLYGPEYLVTQGIILVTFNYRLEILGFLCLGIKEAPGNVGLKDQVLALEWVKKNIKAFGGDPDNITLFGESAGAASVMYHMVSSMSRGLFQKAIMQSGTAISPWSFQFEPVKIASLLAKQMGYETEDPKEIYSIFMNKTEEELIKTRVPRKEGDTVLSETIFVPCVEAFLPDEAPFLTDLPYNLIHKGLYHRIPVIIGYNNAEGYTFAGKENDTTISKLNFYDSLPRDLDFRYEKNKKDTALKLKNLYMGIEPISKNTMPKFAKFQGDFAITYPVVATIELLLNTGNEPVYAYKFSYDGWMNIAKMYFGFGMEPGAAHADDLFYMFKMKLPVPNAFLETKMIRKITTMWTNFAKYSNPTPETTSLLPTIWQPANKMAPHSLIIDNEFSTTPLWDDKIILFWNTTYSMHRRKN